MELDELHPRLKRIQDEFGGSDIFVIETMIKLEKVAKEIKLEAVRIFGEEDEITAELESAILLSKDYGLKTKGSKNESDIGALSHFQYGIALFIDRIEI